MYEIDRISPTHRPDKRADGWQKWRDLLFVHWSVDPTLLRKLVPSTLELDLFEDTAYVGVVPFAMFDVRPKWLPAAFAFNFLETNLRTYVHHQGEPGVYFFSLEAASRLAVWAARTGWGLPYHYAKMRMEKEENTVTYHTQRSSQQAPIFSAKYTIEDPIPPPEPGSLEFFLLERYYLFSEHRGTLQKGQVYHTPYPAHTVTVHEIQDQLIHAAGLPQPQGPPPLAHYSPGVDVEVFDLIPLTSSS